MAEETKEKKDSSRAGKDYLPNEKAKIFLDHTAGRTDTEISRDLKRPRNKSFRENRTKIVQEQIEDMGKQLLDFMHYIAYFKIQRDDLLLKIKKKDLDIECIEPTQKVVKDTVDVILQMLIDGENPLAEKAKDI
tara:strand:+ start:884 stop:1285 length:402 start_codon:yes stop_codon:yes gene_type:complete